MKKEIKKHEGKYIHISKKRLWVFFPLALLSPIIYMIWMILCFLINLIGFSLGIVFGFMVEKKGVKYFWTMQKHSFIELAPKWVFKLEEK